VYSQPLARSLSKTHLSLFYIWDAPDILEGQDLSPAPLHLPLWD
jgi:hypothetical protein